MVSFDLKLSFTLLNAFDTNPQLKFSSGDAIKLVVESQKDGVNTESLESLPYRREERLAFPDLLNVKFKFHESPIIRASYYFFNTETQERGALIVKHEILLNTIIALGSYHQSFDNHNRTTSEIRAVVPDYYSQYISIQFRGYNICPPSNSLPALYYVYSFPTSTRRVLLHKSEIIKFNKNPEWLPFNVPLFLLNHYMDVPMLIEVYNHIGNHVDEFIGSCATTLAQCQSGKAAGVHTYMLISKEEKRIVKTRIELVKFQLMNKPGPTIFKLYQDIASCQSSLPKWIKNPLKVYANIAIDFTASNGNPVQEGSLHHIHPYNETPYIKAMNDILPKAYLFLDNWGTNIGVYGFGANLNYDGGTPLLSNCFALAKSREDNLVHDVPGIISAYKQAVLVVQPYAPTDFSEVIYKTSTKAKAAARQKAGLYFTLFIFSDGGPSTNTMLVRAIDAIVDASFYPMSIFAIGVGENKDFSAMRALTNLTLKHSDGRSLARQNYTFVEASDLANSDALSALLIQILYYTKE